MDIGLGHFLLYSSSTVYGFIHPWRSNSRLCALLMKVNPPRVVFNVTSTSRVHKFKDTRSTKKHMGKVRRYQENSFNAYKSIVDSKTDKNLQQIQKTFRTKYLWLQSVSFTYNYVYLPNNICFCIGHSVL